ncbi:NAD(P)/FAD-dependent oxidoreductase [Coralliovum pocilloporae]|uniref:NAD(P)/FAD-dependent oxidoreductase n=1 Tax=Coralliovum pocilloporae TaxID=3066369 RepID=UPI0033073AF6
MSRKPAENVVVIGAGINGISTGIWLRRAGKAVTVIDRLAPGEGASHGNAGILAACAIVPVTEPGLITKAPGMVIRPSSPLFLKWPYIPRMIPWLLRYLSHANTADTTRITNHLAPVAMDTVEQHKALAENTEAEHWLQESDYVFAYASAEAHEKDRFGWSLREQAGFQPQILDGDDVRAYDPNFGPSVNRLVVMGQHGYVRSPGLYVKALAKHFEALGGTLVKADVKDFDITDGTVKAALTDQGRFPCDALVLATGAWSKALTQKLGLTVPLESERGYHVILKNARGGPKVPSMIAASKFVATPMEDGLRCAGLVEFGGLEASPSTAPIELLMRGVRTAFPQIDYDETEEWLGHRPAPTDSLPLIGELNSCKGAYTAFGHQHIGLTCGAKTGRLVADMIADKGINLDMKPYDPNRFR